MAAVTRKTTLRLYADANNIDSAASHASLAQAALIVRNGGTVAFPTETVYGLGANALDALAVASIFEAKQRPAWDPLIVHVAAKEQLALVTGSIPALAHRLMDAFWPGPLTLLLPKAVTIPPIVTAGRPRVGVRMPRHPVARRLIELAGVPIAAPSANSFGRTSPTRAEFVLQDLEGRIDAVIDGGETSLGLESTVVDVCDEPPVLYRPGMITLQQLRDLCPSLIVYRDTEKNAAKRTSLPAPGVGLKHYAPRARLIVVEEHSVQQLLLAAAPFHARGETVGLMLPAGSGTVDGFLVYEWGDWRNPSELASRLFAGLRELDEAGATVIVCPLPEEDGLGSAMRDRLLKAAR